MPRKANGGVIHCEFFTWRLFQRAGVYYADGRSDEQNLGKHSLGTRDHEEAMSNLHMLDRKLATERGMVPTNTDSTAVELPVVEGWCLFMEHCNRPQVMGGVSRSTYKRYRAVRDKFIEFCKEQELKYWSEIDKRTVQQYGKWLEKRGYADRSQYLELNLVISVVKWLIEEERLSSTARIKMKLSKPEGSDTHCYSHDEVIAIIDYCDGKEELSWLKDVIIGLATTGMRVGEFVSLQWRDIDFAANTIQLTDERSSSRRKKLGRVRTTKGRRGRALPLHTTFRKVLEKIPHDPDGFIFHGPRGGRLKPDLIRRMLISKVLEPLKGRFPTPEGDIGFEHGRVHSFRHFFISEAFRQGVSEAQIMEWVGHKDSDMVKLYRHLRADDSHRHMSQLDFGTGSPAIDDLDFKGNKSA